MRGFDLRSPRIWMAAAAMVLIAVAVVLAAWAWPVPRIAIEPKTQDLGERPQQRLELVYTVRNSGKSDLRVLDITTTCGCTKASIDRDTIPPGESALLHVTMDPQEDNLYGDLFRIIIVRTNDPSTPLAQVDFRVVIPKP